MDYGKMIGGEFFYAPKILYKDGKQYINPDEQMYLEFGYLPLKYTEAPEDVNGCHKVSSWVVFENEIIQVWNYEADDELTTLTKRLKELEEKVKELTDTIQTASDK